MFEAPNNRTQGNSASHGVVWKMLQKNQQLIWINLNYTPPPNTHTHIRTKWGLGLKETCKIPFIYLDYL